MEAQAEPAQPDHGSCRPFRFNNNVPTGPPGGQTEKPLLNQAQAARASGLRDSEDPPDSEAPSWLSVPVTCL
jgi:hypothetical protein